VIYGFKKVIVSGGGGSSSSESSVNILKLVAVKINKTRDKKKGTMRKAANIAEVVSTLECTLLTARPWAERGS